MAEVSLSDFAKDLLQVIVGFKLSLVIQTGTSGTSKVLDGHIDSGFGWSPSRSLSKDPVVIRYNVRFHPENDCKTST